MIKIKISELPAASSFQGLYTIGTDAGNNSVKVPLQSIEDKAAEASAQAQAAAQSAAEAAGTVSDAAHIQNLGETPTVNI